MLKARKENLIKLNKQNINISNIFIYFFYTKARSIHIWRMEQLPSAKSKTSMGMHKDQLWCHMKSVVELKEFNVNYLIYIQN